jgi:hypothetical protein
LQLMRRFLIVSRAHQSGPGISWPYSLPTLLSRPIAGTSKITDPILSAYWRNYVLDPDSPHADEVIRTAIAADRQDLRALFEEVDVVHLAEEAVTRAEQLLEVDQPIDVVLMVGVGAANAGELVVHGKGVAFVCVEHFTGRVNPSTYGMGLAPGLLPSGSRTRSRTASDTPHPRARARSSGWSPSRAVTTTTGPREVRATLRELLVNEGVAVHAPRPWRRIRPSRLLRLSAASVWQDARAGGLPATRGA